MSRAPDRVLRFLRGGTLARLGAASWGQITAALISLLALRFYTGRMPAAVFGEAMLVLGVLAFIDGVFGMAFNQTLVVMLKDLATRAARLRLALGLGVLFARWTLCIASIAALVAIAVGMATGVAPVLLVIGVAAALTYTLVEPVRIIGQTINLLERRYMSMSSWQAVDALAGVTTTLVILHLTRPNPLSLCVGLVGGRLISTTLFWTMLFGPRALLGADVPQAKAERGRALRFALPVSAMAPLGWASLYIDRYVVGATIGPASAGLLAALTGAVTRPYSIVSSALTNFYRPDMLDHVAGRAPAHRHPLRDWIVVAVIAGLIGVAAMVVLGPAIVGFLIRFRTGVTDGATLLVLIALSQVLVLVTHAIDNQVLAMERSRSLLGSQSVAVALGLPMIAAGALAGGIVGAAWGRVGNEAVKLVFAAYLLGRPRLRRGAQGTTAQAARESA